MVVSSRALLSAVTRLLILADMIDVHLLLAKVRSIHLYIYTKLLLSQLHTVQTDLAFLTTVSSQAELLEGMDR